MVITFAPGNDILDQTHHLLVMEYLCESHTSYFEFDYYTKSEKNQRLEDVLFINVIRSRLHERIFTSHDLIELFE